MIKFTKQAIIQSNAIRSSKIIQMSAIKNILLLGITSYVVVQPLKSSGIAVTSLTLSTLLGLLIVCYYNRQRYIAISNLSSRLEQQSICAMFSTPNNWATLVAEKKSNPLSKLEEQWKLKSLINGTGLPATLDSFWVPFHLLVLLAIDIRIGSLSCFCVFILILIHQFREFLTFEESRNAKTKQAETKQSLTSFFNSLDSAVAMGMHQNFKDFWSKQHHFNQNLLSACHSANRFFLSLLRIFCNTSLCAFAILGVHLTFSSDLTYTTLAITLIVFYQIIFSLNDALEFYSRVKSENLDPKNIFNIVPTNTVANAPINRDINIELCNVTIGHDQTSPLIYSTDLYLSPNKIHLFKGQANSGKTALCRAILGLEPCHQGVIKIAGIDSTIWKEHDRAKNIAYASQQTELISGTVAENISRFSGKDISYVIKAAKRAGAHSDILRLPQNYYTKIDSNSALLSRLLRQKIALARTVYGTPKLIVLDDPSEQLCASSNAQMLRLIRNLRDKGATIIITSSSDNFDLYADHNYQLIDSKILEGDSNIRISSMFSTTQKLNRR